ncbi:MAG: class I SAM-dependent methyltransferase [Anaeromicrobium sp.]|jgi:cyclopropane fatty-acyl-phospholipid synthase-like methyltransferase|uniref:class I SAM-dependent methyltransferase n=1 Tax=Anaeromicrobium sp. TaxID=1929132 RepID=UPI0025EEC32A|nr:class I SAM-dependent methyltransferase [Anaeromicrobium sp.]MCT4594971.1 class I SAM-dependent methyltransferase [Anaeromicrobium sp.]
MSFYEKLSTYYDVVFKTGENQLKFIKKYMGDRKKLLDVAAGTGNYSISLSKDGYEVDSLELDSHMVDLLEDKATGESIDMDIYEMNMMDIHEIDKRYDGVYCIGNSLVHLNGKEEIGQFLKKTYDMLNHNGVIIIQIVNYDRVMKNNVTKLPTIDRSQEGVLFERLYSRKDDKVIFTGNLSIIEENKEYTSHVELFPLLKEDLEELLKRAGFRNMKFFGGFDESEYSDETFANVIVAYKG